MCERPLTVQVSDIKSSQNYKVIIVIAAPNLLFLCKLYPNISLMLFTFLNLLSSFFFSKYPTPPPVTTFKFLQISQIFSGLNLTKSRLNTFEIYMQVFKLKDEAFNGSVWEANVGEFHPLKLLSIEQQFALSLG